MPAGHMLLLMAANARKQDTQLFMAAECLRGRHFAAGSLIEESASGEAETVLAAARANAPDRHISRASHCNSL